jgi:hypothetical protein
MMCMSVVCGGYACIYPVHPVLSWLMFCSRARSYMMFMMGLSQAERSSFPKLPFL